MPRPFRSKAVASLLALAGITVVFACSDITAPRVSSIETVLAPKLSLTASDSVMVQVLPDSMRGWSLIDDQTSVACTDATRCVLVDGPVAASGASVVGSLELAVNAGSEGKAAVLQAYQGTRLDRLSALRYSTYRQTADAGNNLAISLQLNIDYDLNDNVATYQGRLVFEPYQGASGTVVAGQWQQWDARAGRWWGTKTTVTRAGTSTANPCVQATPCTWTQLRTVYPNAGIHATYGAVLLKAGSGWASFRGNVNLLTIGVDSSRTTYQFAAHAPVLAKVRLRAVRADGVTGTVLPADTLYTVGAVVPYAFGARPGRREALLVIDDTLTPVSGSIVMNRDHTIEVVSDTLYTTAGLSPLERTIADHLNAWLHSTDPLDGEVDLVKFYIQTLLSGVSSADFAHAVEIASFTALDAVRDSVLLRRMDHALASRHFYIDIYGPTEYDVYYDNSPLAVRANARAMSMRAQEGGTRAKTDGAALAMDGEDPREETNIIYTNGMLVDREGEESESASAAWAMLERALMTQPRFNNGWSHVLFHYNRKYTEQRADFERDHHCSRESQEQQPGESLIYRLKRWVTCKGGGAINTLTTFDLIEAATDRAQAMLRLPPSNPDVDSLARFVSTLRQQSNVILVGHSQGTIIDALALQRVPAIDHLPLQRSWGCTAAFALAPATSKSSYVLDNYHVNGLLAANDVIHVVLPTGWTDIETPNSATARARGRGDQLATTFYGIKVHSVIETYLTQLRPELLAGISDLHRECIVESASTAPASLSPAVGETFTVRGTALNENGRVRTGREGMLQADGYYISQLDSVTFRAMTPSDQPLGVQFQASPVVSAQTRVDLPPVHIAVTVTVTSDDNGKYYSLAYNHLDSLPSGRLILGRRVFFLVGNELTELQDTISCGIESCRNPAYVEMSDERGHVVARSGPVSLP